MAILLAQEERQLEKSKVGADLALAGSLSQQCGHGGQACLTLGKTLQKSGQIFPRPPEEKMHHFLKE